MKAEIQENVVLYDWLSFTTKRFEPEELIFELGLSDCPWQQITGMHGYRDRLYFGSISIHYNGREDMGVWCEMSGQGCRNFESLSALPGDKWKTLFSFIQSNNMHITRLDVAYDDHTGVLDIDRIAHDILVSNFVGPIRKGWVEFAVADRQRAGTSCYLGRPSSRVRIRIYDKAAERGLNDGSHWVRVELQLRDSRAEEFLKIPLPIGEAFAGVMLNYVRFVVPSEDSNRSRWETADYWQAFIGDVGRIRIFTAPGTEYNEKKCRQYVCVQAGNAVDALIRMHGVKDFLRLIHSRPCAHNPKYDQIVAEHRAKQEAWRKRVAEYLDVEYDRQVEEQQADYVLVDTATGEVLDYDP